VVAAYEIEAAFVGQFWAATDSDDDKEQALAWGASALQPEALQASGLRALFELLRSRFVLGERNDTAEVATAIADNGGIAPADRQAAAEQMGSVYQLPIHGAAILRDSQRREAVGLVEKTRDYLMEGDRKSDGGRAVAEKLSFRLMDLYGRRDAGGWKDRATLINEAIERSNRGETSGVVVPYQKLDQACGPWIGGDVVGVTGFSNSGKSNLLANLFLDLTTRGVPCIVFPTEMGGRFLDRVGAVAARIDQRIAEKHVWKGHEAQRDRFQGELERIRALEWAMVDRGEIGPAEVATAIRILRRKWPGQTVVAMVDHIHRLQYPPGISADEQEGAGAATRMLKNVAVEDGRLVNVLLYQPRKPATERDRFRPVSGSEIRGHSEVWNELDIHLSPFRAWVETTAFLTEWGTRKAKVFDDGRPELARPEAEGAKVDDEHFFVKVEKRRIGGEGPKLWLNIHGPSGRIYEEANMADAECRTKGL
jgi:replicative DNA helicase